MYVVMDIETVYPPDLEQELRLIKPAANIVNPDKIAANLEKRRKAMAGKSALTDSAPIGCVGIKTPEFVACFVSFTIGECISSLNEANIFVIENKDEKELLENLCNFLNAEFDETELVTFNGIGFDAPKVRFRCARHGLKIPGILSTGNNHVDLMRRYSKYFSMSQVPFVSMGEVAERLGIEHEKGSGALFPEMIEQGQYFDAVCYNINDLLITEEIYRRICNETSRSRRVASKEGKTAVRSAW